ncbi:MAG: M20/M25/M40 family metallo-hydrolase [Bacteroidota bacterium]
MNPLNCHIVSRCAGTHFSRARTRALILLLTGILSVSGQMVLSHSKISNDTLSNRTFHTDHQTNFPSISANAILNHVKVLASDSLEGRRAGTPAADKAAAYIAKIFEENHLLPAGDKGTWFQHFDFISGVKLGEHNAATLTLQRKHEERILTVGRDFIPLSFTKDTTVSASLVFVGYGISAPDLGYDDYKSIDVTGKIAVAFRYSPEGEIVHGRFSRYSLPRFKAITARQKGAAGLVLITGPAQDKEDQLPKLRYDNDPGDVGIPIIALKRKFIEPFLDEKLSSLQKQLDSTQVPVSREIPGIKLTIQTDVRKIHAQTANVIGYLRGRDSILHDQVLILGAHYDHLGWGGEGSMMPDTIAIHHGADDNASGTAGLLELARVFAQRADELKRTLVFISFGAEEEGTIGSQYYVKHPAFPLEKTIGMLNMDMIGRMKDSTLIIYGTGTSPEWKTLLAKFNSDSSFHLKLNPEGYGPSDQASFYAKDLPVLFFFTGLHEDYHRPTDTWEKINASEEARLVQYISEIAFAMDTMRARPLFTKVESAPASTEGRGYGVYMGTIPDFGEQVSGFRIAGVRHGSPAEKAGLQTGDIIVKFGNMEIKNLYDFTYALGEHRPGEEVPVVVKRNNRTFTVTVKLEKRR